MKKKYFTEEERILAKKTYNKEWCRLNREKVNNTQRKWSKTHQDYRKHYENKRYNNDIIFKLRKRLRNRLRDALNNGYKSGSAVRDLGCSIPELKNYLESKFQEGMTWENWSFKGWHIDHIIPLDFFNLQNRDEFLKACHYTNLQPLWSSDNIRKKNKFYINSNEGE